MSLQQSTTPSINYQSIEVLGNPFSLPEYKPKAAKKIKKSYQDPHVKDSPVTILSILETDKIIASSGYSSSDRHSKGILGNDLSETHEPITKYRKSLPSIAINMKTFRHPKKQYRSRTPEHCIQKKNGDDTRNRSDTQLSRTDTEFAGPKPYFVKRKPINKDSVSYVHSSHLVHQMNTDGSYSNPFHPNNVHKMEREKAKRKKKNAKYLSINNVQRNGNPFIVDDDIDDAYSCYSEGVLYR